MDILEELKDLKKLIGENQAEAWNHNLSMTSTAVILEDLTVHGCDEDDKEAVVTLTYNYWADKLEAIIRYMEDRDSFTKKTNKEEFIEGCISSGKAISGDFFDTLSDMQITQIELFCFHNSDDVARKLIEQILR